MVHYNFKEICIIPSANEFIDIVLSKTQRKTPTVVHRRYKISSIRQFYMRKVKFCSSTIKERIIHLLTSFPQVDNIHPFYGDLIHVLYDKDHYKLALGQLNAVKNTADRICKDYIKLLKYADSLYRCKQLKKAALGRMCTSIKKLDVSLKYLEEVRKHLARLPSIDPAERTLILTGFPNVGKSSFINKVSRADVDVQPYAFTTKSLFVGHFFHNYLRWQIIDTPGILDHPLQSLEGCNTIEMQAITAIAHIQSCVLFFIDISPGCEYSIEKQLHLFEFLRPIFSARPIVFVASKSDLRRLSELEKTDFEKISSTSKKYDIPIIELSNLSEEGIMDARNNACERLLKARVEKKLESKHGTDIRSRLNITNPAKRDHKPRPPSIPLSVIKEKSNPSGKHKTPEEVRKELAATGATGTTLRNHWNLFNSSWKNHKIPEIYKDQNIVDWIDPDIERKLDELEKKENEASNLMEDDSEGFELDEDESELFEAIKNKIGIKRATAFVKNSGNKPRMSRLTIQTSEMGEKLGEIGYNTTKAVERIKTNSKKLRGKEILKKKINKEREELLELAKADKKSLDFVKKLKLQRARHKLAGKGDKISRAGPADRSILSKKPKHLFSGKRKLGKTDRR